MGSKAVAALCAAIATALMALGAATATARNLSLSDQNIRITFTDLEFRAGEVRQDCHVTLEGSFHRATFAKSPEALVGYLTRALPGQCSLGLTILAETLPWHVRYQGFGGTLPEIASITAKIFGASFRVSTCLLRGNIEFVAVRDPVTRVLTGVEVPLERNSELPLTGLLCPEPRLGNLRSNGQGTVTVLASASRITVTLI